MSCCSPGCADKLISMTAPASWTRFAMRAGQSATLVGAVLSGGVG